MEELQVFSAPCHQDRAERGQLESTRSEMAGLQGEGGDDWCEMVPNGSAMDSLSLRLSMATGGCGTEEAVGGSGQATASGEQGGVGETASGWGESLSRGRKGSGI